METRDSNGPGSFVSYLRVSTAAAGHAPAWASRRSARRSRIISTAATGSRSPSSSRSRSAPAKGERPKLQAALTYCKLTGATAGDREARPPRAKCRLHLEPDGEPGSTFVAVDFPQANGLTVHILAAVAEHEAEAISTAPRRRSRRRRRRVSRSAAIASLGCSARTADDLQGLAEARAGASRGGSSGAQGGVAGARAGAGSDDCRPALAGGHEPAPASPGRLRSAVC